MRTYFTIISGNGLASILQFLGALVQARLLDPSDMGLFRAVAIPLSYMMWLHLGTFDGLSREFPFCMGKGNVKKAEDYASVTQFWIVLLIIFSSATFVGLALYDLINGRTLSAMAWATQIFFASSTFYGDFYLTAFYRLENAKKLTYLRLIQQIVSLLLIAAVYLYGPYGLYLRAALTALFGVVLLHAYRPFSVRPSWSWSDFKHLVAVGLPTSASGYVTSALWLTLDATLLLAFCGQEALGLYAVVAMVWAALNTVSDTVGLVCMAKGAELYGKTGSLRQVIKMAVQPSVMLVCCYGTVTIVAWLTMHALLPVILPKYAHAEAALKWAFVLCIARSSTPLLFVLFSVRRQGIYLLAGLLGIASYCAFLSWELQSSRNIDIFPKALIVGRVAMTIAGLAWLFTKQKKQSPATTPTIRETICP